MTRAARPPVPDGPYLVVGLGRAGIAAAEALGAHAGAAAVTVVDEGHPADAGAAIGRLRAAGVRVVTGVDGVGHLPGVRTVVKSPGVPFTTAVLRAAAARGIAVIDELELGWRLSEAMVVGVTGTNGKSTVSHLLSQFLDAPVAGNTMLGPPLSRAPATSGWQVCEISSYQLEGCPALLPELAVLTNLRPDHLERHETLTAYAGVKRRLFVRGDRAAGIAVLDARDPVGALFALEVEARGGRAVRVGSEAGADVRLLGAGWSLTEARLLISLRGERLDVRTRLPGPHNAGNALLALAAADALGLELERILDVLERTPGIPGRFEPIDAGQDFDVIVDFAHTPDALAAVLGVARGFADDRGTRVHVVICDAGHRTAALREPFGRTAASLADHVVVTEGSSGRVPTADIVAPLLRGALGARRAGVEHVADRRAAFRAAFAGAGAGDIVLIAGRGAIPVLQTGPDGAGIPFDDRQVAREELAPRQATATT
jgi:UDP-N-acetylmuramyl tripeptide synthase